jgi:DNA-binding protein YbaB
MTFIVFDPLPAPLTLQSSLTTIEQQLDAVDTLLRGKSYPASSSDQNIKVTATGAMELSSVTITAAATNPANPGALGPLIVPVVNQALTAAKGQSPTDVASAVANMNLLGICTPSGSLPNYAGFPEAAAVFAAEKPTIDARIAARTFQATSGDVTATVNGALQVVTITVARISDVLANLTGDVMKAVNMALDAAMGLVDVTVGQQTDLLATNSVAFSDVCLYARGQLQLSDGVVVKTAAGVGAPVANAGNSGTTIGNNARCGNVWSLATVTMQSSGRVDGFVKTLQTFTGVGSPVVSGGVSQGAFFVLPELSLVPTFPSTNQGSVTVANGQTTVLAPGTYDQITVNSGGTLKLSAGTYFANIVNLQTGGSTIVDSSGGRVVLHVHTVLQISHTIKSAGTGAPNLFVGYYGLQTINLAAPYSGTLIAPGATINLSPANAHSGAFFGASITTAANTTVTFVPYAGAPTLGTF